MDELAINFDGTPLEDMESEAHCGGTCDEHCSFEHCADCGQPLHEDGATLCDLHTPDPDDD